MGRRGFTGMVSGFGFVAVPRRKQGARALHIIGTLQSGSEAGVHEYVHTSGMQVLQGRCRGHIGRRRFSRAASRSSLNSAARPPRPGAHQQRAGVLRRIGIPQARGDFLKMHIHMHMHPSLLSWLQYDATLTVSICSRLIHDVNEATTNQ